MGADRSIVNAAVVNGSRGSSLSERNISRMKGSLKGAAGFVQDNKAEALMAQLSGNDPMAKDDILILDSKGRVVRYWDANKSALYNPENEIFKTVKAMANKSFKNPCADAKPKVNECVTGKDNCDANATCTDTEDSFTCKCKGGYRGDGVTCAPWECKIGATGAMCLTCKALPWRTGANQCTSCNTGYELMGTKCIQSLPELPDPNKPNPKACDVREQKVSGGKRVPGGKTKTACECHDVCKKKAENRTLLAYTWKKPGFRKNGKKMKKGQCRCLPPLTSTRFKGKVRFQKKPQTEYLSGLLAE